jgi:hypothetical protein
MLAWVAVAQNVVAEARVRAAARPPEMEPVRVRAVAKTRPRAAAAVMAEKRFRRQAGADPIDICAKSHPSIVWRG